MANISVQEKILFQELENAPWNVSVIICAYTEDRWKELVAALDSVRGQTCPAQEIILVIDHNPALFERARRQFPQETVIENQEEKGLSGARNSGIAIARGKIIAFMDEDAVAEPDWLERLLAAYAAPQVSGVGGAIRPFWLVNPPGWFPEEFNWVIGCTYKGMPEHLAPVRNLIGANMSFRRTVFQECGGFRCGLGRVGTLPLGCEETELCIRAQQRWPEQKFLFEPAALVQHRVPGKRGNFRYFASRCFAEGISKAAVSQLVGTRDGLASEREYTWHTLPRAIWQGLRDGLRGRLSGFGRAAAVLAGLGITGLGFVRGRMFSVRLEKPLHEKAADSFRPIPPAPFPEGKGEKSKRFGDILPPLEAKYPHFSMLPSPSRGGAGGGVSQSNLAARAGLSTKIERPRILMVTPRFFPEIGGVENHVYQVALRLAGNAEVTVLTTDRSGKLPRSEMMDGIRIQRVRAWPKGSDLYMAPQIYTTIRKGHWDLIHIQSYHTFVPPLAMLAALQSHTPYVVTFHGGGHSSRLRNAIRVSQRGCLRPLLRRAERIVAVANFEIEQYGKELGLPPERFTLIPNGSDLPKLPATAASPAETMIASVGRLERYKGHQRIIAALPFILKERPDVHLWIAGSGPYETDLLRLAQKYGVQDHVRIQAIPVAERDRMAIELSQASLFVLLSEFETHPIAVLEAVSLGVPALVADTSGLSELSEQGLARSISLKSNSQEIANAVLEQLKNPLVPPRLALLTWDDCALDLFNLYQEIINQSSRE